MPIVTWWPNLVVTFELTMLFGIVATFVTLLVTARLPWPRSALYDEQIADGMILVGLERSSSADLVQAVLIGAGASSARILG